LENCEPMRGLSVMSGPKINESISEQAPALITAGATHWIDQNRLAYGMILLLALAAVPVFFHFMSPSWLFAYSQYLIQVPFLAILLFTLHIMQRHVEDPKERLFWMLLFFGFTSWLASIIFSLVFLVIQPDGNFLENVLTYGPQLIFYSCFIAALEIQPHVGRRRFTHQLQILSG